jgi:hypothetical protein
VRTTIRVVALILIPAAFVATVLTVPSCVEHLMEKPPDWKKEEDMLERNALRTIAKYKEMYGNLPVEEWPEEGHRQTYKNAVRIIEEAGRKRGKR